MIRLVLALACLLSPSLAAQSASDLPRIGDQISDQEAGYFGLFPSLDGFESAVVTWSGASADILVRRAAQPDTSVALSAEQVVALRQYLLLFEDLQAVEALDLAPLDGLFRYRKRRFDPISVTVDVLDGPELSGDLLSADERALIVWTDDRPFSWELAQAPSLVVLQWDEVEELHTSGTRLLDRSRRFGYGVGVGGLHVLAGAGAGAAGDAGFLGALPSVAGAAAGAVLAFGPTGENSGFYVGGSRANARTTIASLSGPTGLVRGSAFPTGVPPEIHVLLPTSPTGGTPAASPATRTSQLPNKRIHFGLNTAYIAPVSGTYAGTYVTGTSREVASKVSGPLAAFRFDAAYSFTDRVRVGVSARIGSPGDAEPAVALAGGSSVAPYIGYVVRQASTQPGGFDDRLEATIGAGVSLNRSVVSVPFTFPASVRGLDPDLPENVEERTAAFGIGPYLRAGLALYTTPTTSVYVDLGFRLFPEVDVPATERRYRAGTSSGVVYSFEAFTARPSPFEMGIGVRWHL